MFLRLPVTLVALAEGHARRSGEAAMTTIEARRRAAPARIWGRSAGLVVFLLFSPRPARAATFRVDRNDDVAVASACADAVPGDCSLRGAILAANALGEPSTIEVPAGTYSLTEPNSCTHVTTQFGTLFYPSTTALCVTKPMTIAGAGAATTTIDAGGLAPAFLVGAGASPAALESLTVRNGSFGSGGGLNNAGDLTIADCVLRDNTGGYGGAVYNSNIVTIRGSTLSANVANNGSGGAIYNDAHYASATTSVVDSTVSGNQSSTGGGAIGNNLGHVFVTGSTISTNSGKDYAGAIWNVGGPGTDTLLVVTNSTISDNENHGSYGGAILNSYQATVELRSATLANNHAGMGTANGYGGGISNRPFGVVRIANSLIANNTASGQGADCYGVNFESLGHNLVGFVDFTCTIGGDTTGDVTNQDPLIGPLSQNGGPTETHPLLPSSPALDAGDPAGCTDSDGNPLATDQRGSPRAVDGDGDGTARCDIGAYEATDGLSLTAVQPTEGGNSAALILVVHGGGFADGSTVRLARAGEADIVGGETAVGESGAVLVSSLDLAGRATGAWDVVVTNPDGTGVRRAGLFTIAPARAPDLWVDVIGPRTVRVGRAYRYLFLYGNRGNTDAFAVPLVIGVAAAVDVTPRFDIAPPPKIYGQTVILEWGQFYREILVGDPLLHQLTLLLPVVPAGFSGVLEVSVTAPFGAENAPFSVRVEHTAPLLDGGVPDAAQVAKLVEGAREKSERLFDYTIPAAIADDMRQYLEAQLQVVADEGVHSLVESFGTAPRFYSLSQIGYDLAAFGYIWAATHPTLALLAPADRGPLLPFVSRLAGAAADLCVGTASAQELACGCGVIPPGGVICCDGCTCKTKDDGDKDPKPPDSCLAHLDDIKKGKCKLPKTPSECREIGYEVVLGKDASGNDSATCTNDRRCAFPNPFAPSSCSKFPVDPKVSHDPNDKIGPAGAGDAHFVTDAVPLEYTIQFENDPGATAPAAEVLVTDQLDPALVDLTTLALGPIAFGDTQVVPPPGLSSFTRDVDLRPARDLIVRIEAGVDPAGLLSWRLESLDPATLEPPTDPLAGFLPPNANPPEGDGYVSFTVAQAPGLATGTAIANQARIVFDANPPIDTPIWSNTIDATPPASQIASLVPVGECTQDLQVGWSGSDVGSGIGGYSIEVSEDGGPFSLWLASDESTATFPGRWGRSYAFRSIAADAAGNVEEPPGAPGAPTTISDCGPHDLAVTKISAPRTVTLTRKRPARTRLVKVQIQNRGAVSEAIADPATLARLVALRVDPLGSCSPAEVKLHQGKPQKALPILIRPKQRANVVFDVLLDCASDGEKGSGHEDFTLSASVDQTALGGVDAHPDDDACPRAGVKPPVRDPISPRIPDLGCGSRQPGGALGDPVLIDVTVR
jgi:hypothetical protein